MHGSVQRKGPERTAATLRIRRRRITTVKRSEDQQTSLKLVVV